MKMMEKIFKMSFFVVGIAFLTAGCTSTKVVRVDQSEKIDLSGGWNDYDAMLVAEEMVKDSLSKPWLGHFTDNNGRIPVIIVGNVRNKSHEHIDSEVFTKFLEKELLNSGKVVFVASPVERQGLREERDDQQQGFTSQDSMAALGKELGADFMLIGSIHSVKDEIKGKYVISYEVNLELVNLSTNQKVWIGQKLLKKKVEQSRFSL